MLWGMLLIHKADLKKVFDTIAVLYLHIRRLLETIIIERQMFAIVWRNIA